MDRTLLADKRVLLPSIYRSTVFVPQAAIVLAPVARPMPSQTQPQLATYSYRALLAPTAQVQGEAISPCAPRARTSQ